MMQTDPYPVTGTPAGGPGGVARAGALRSVLWVVVVISTVANMAASYSGAHLWVHLACGLATVLCAGTLVVRNLRGRR
jgi:hypothetical protein